MKLSCGDNGFIRPINVEDVTSDYIDGLNDPEVNRFLEIGKGPAQTLESATQFILEQHSRTDAYLFGLFVEGLLRGTCRLHEITEFGADIGIAIFDKSIWGEGWGV